MRRRIALLLAAFLTPALAIYSVFTIVSRSDEGFGEWQKMEARQVSVPLAPGTVAVEIADLESGWTERVSVQSDGRRVLSGVPDFELDASPLARPDAETVAYWRRELGPLAEPHGQALQRALALTTWVHSRAYAGEDAREAALGASRAAPIASVAGREILASVDRGNRFN